MAVNEVKPPTWLLVRERELCARSFGDDNERMTALLEVAAENVAQGGGPFAAAVFDNESGGCVALGANIVVPLRNSLWHAEVVALWRAQQTLKTHDLATKGSFALVTSVEPCLMCMGAVLWSGVTRLVCGATGADAEAIGFDEGPKPPQWAHALRQRGIAVRQRVLPAAARAVLRDYADRGGAIYNSARLRRD